MPGGGQPPAHGLIARLLGKSEVEGGARHTGSPGAVVVEEVGVGVGVVVIIIVINVVSGGDGGYTRLLCSVVLFVPLCVETQDRPCTYLNLCHM